MNDDIEARCARLRRLIDLRYLNRPRQRDYQTNKLQLKPEVTNMNIDNCLEIDFESLLLCDAGMTGIIDFSTLPDEVEFTTTAPAAHDGPTARQKILAALQRTPPERSTVPWVWLRNMLDLDATTIGRLRATATFEEQLAAIGWRCVTGGHGRRRRVLFVKLKSNG
jgi:hypothetical protein